MNRNLKHILKEYPFLEISKEATKEGITWLDSIDSGWLAAFGNDFCEELKEAIKKDDCEREFMIVEIKEKFGFMNVYVMCAGEYTYDVISKYEELSKYICGHCGQTADYVTLGWYYPICKDCADSADYGGRYTTVEEFYGFEDREAMMEHIQCVKTDFLEYQNLYK